MNDARTLPDPALGTAEPTSPLAHITRLIDPWSVPVVLVDREGSIRAWNKGAATLYGMSEESVLARPWTSVVSEATSVEPPHTLGTETSRYETRHSTADGRAVDVMVTRTDLLSADGQPSGALLLITDLTESKAIDVRLKRRVAELSIVREIGEVLQSTMDLTGILRAILVGATASQGLRCNRAFLLLVDAARGELRGRVAIGPSDAEEANRVWGELTRTEADLKQLLRTYEPFFERSDTPVNLVVRSLGARLEGDGDFLARAVRSEETIRVVDGMEAAGGAPVDPALLERLGVGSFVAVPLRAEGKPMGLLLADNAITGKAIEDQDVAVLELLGMQAALAIERAQLSGELATKVASLEAATREIRSNHELLVRAERLAAIGEMAARVAHEIRNPLVAIGGFARVLLREAPADSPVHDNAQIIASEVARLEALLKDVLDYSNPIPPRLAKVDLARLALEALDLLRWEMHEAGIVGSLDAEAGLPEAKADRNQIFQALINVMHNAIHAMPQGGTLTLRAGRKMGAFELSVTDTGPGIPLEVRERIFEPFFTLRATGSGLGLTIAQQILLEHGGEIQVDSRVGVGTTFMLRLPGAEQETPHERVEDSGG